MKDSAASGPACTGTATYHKNPYHLAAINPCILHEKVTAGHNHTAAARYDNSQPWQDVMGIMLTYVWWGTQ